VPKRARQLTFTDARLDRGRGGPRTGAGRPRVYARPPVHHVRRLRVPRHCPSHVTLRVRQGVPSLRTKRFLKAFRSSLRESSERGNFRVVHYSLQRDHVHLLVEAAGKRALADGMKSISPRLARCVHRVYGRRGPVLFGRYHIKALRTPLEVHRALRYVLLNTRRHWKKRHGQAPAVVRLDEASSGRWFDGWTRLFQSLPAPPERETASPRTWLLSEGWRRHGRIDPAAVPGPA
jgi:REP element-mobilizing transposase RayT